MFPTSDMLLTWNEYVEWEKDESEVSRVQERYMQAQQKIDLMVNFEEKFQQAYVDLDTNNHIEPMLALLEQELPAISGDNFNYVLLYFERILSEYTLNIDLWQLFMTDTDEICKKKEQKIAIYEKAVKNCPKESEFWLSYLRELEKNDVEGDKI